MPRSVWPKAVLASLALLGSPARGEPAFPPCTLGDVDWRQDRVFIDSRHPAVRGRAVASLACKTVATIVHLVGAG